MSEQNIIQSLRKSIHQHIVGKDSVIDLLLCALLARGHVLIEDVPGVGKTTIASALAQSIEGSFQRIQFTSDLLPADIIGVPIFNSDLHHFEFHPGPIFSNIVLADEINRTTPKTQSALLEAMQEGQVTVDRETHTLNKPFMVIATQNPMEQFGTYPLPESQLDRFLFKLNIGYPEAKEELGIVQSLGKSFERKKIAPVCATDHIVDLQKAVSRVHIDPSLQQYIVDIVRKTRESTLVSLGVSPRGTVALYRASQALAFIQGKDFVSPDDIKILAPHVLAHRITLSAHQTKNIEHGDYNKMQKDAIIDILDQVMVPL
ncbi:MoxR family ATPase [bacterium]|nr:MoxR family ATPase [bacterium]